MLQTLHRSRISFRAAHRASNQWRFTHTPARNSAPSSLASANPATIDKALSAFRARDRSKDRHYLRIGAGVAFTALIGSGVLFLRKDDGSASDPVLGRPNPADKAAIALTPTTKLLSGWIVYAFCSSPTLLDWSEPLFNFCRRIPLVSCFVDVAARHTFFAQFLGAETAEEAEVKVWTPLRNRRIGTLTAYNVEGEVSGGLNSPEFIDDIVQGTLNAIEALGTFGVAHSSPAEVANGDTRCWLRLKLSGMVPDPETLVRAAENIVAHRKGNVHYPGVPEDGDVLRLFDEQNLSQSDVKALHDLHEVLREFMRRAQKYGVQMIIDAEYSWNQPAVDILSEELMREFNSGQGPPIVCASFQAYLRRNAEMIRTQVERAHQGGYKLIFKQVRGAYLPYEHARWTRLCKNGPPPVWSTKAETDASYDAGIKHGLKLIKHGMVDDKAPDVGMILATHNEVSVDRAVQLIDELGLGTKQDDGSLRVNAYTANRLAFAQIYGMKDNLTNRINASVQADSGLPVVCKSSGYGSLEHGLPNLSRRAAENKTVMEGRGGAISERKRIGRELLRRFVPFYDY